MDQQELDKLDNIHTLWHHVSREIQGLEYLKLVLKLEELMSDYPQILTSYCDDDHFMSSEIYYIPHESSENFMGYTMLILSQCDEGLTEMFLYPGHINSMISATKEMDLAINKFKGPCH